MATQAKFPSQAGHVGANSFSRRIRRREDDAYSKRLQESSSIPVG